MSHPGPGVLKPSIASLVFSVDKWATKYLAYTAVQHPRVEIVVHLGEMVKAAIVVFGSKQLPPSRIIVYRDGVSDGEFEKVGQFEIPAIKGTRYSSDLLFTRYQLPSTLYGAKRK